MRHFILFASWKQTILESYFECNLQYAEETGLGSSISIYTVRIRRPKFSVSSHSLMVSAVSRHEGSNVPPQHTIIKLISLYFEQYVNLIFKYFPNRLPTR